jgi:hypothetical protein
MSVACEEAIRVAELFEAITGGVICPASSRYESRLTKKALTLRRVKVGV